MAPLVLSSKVHEVTVHRVGARVTRVAPVPAAETGVARDVVLTGLPLALDDGSLRVRVEPAEGAPGTPPVAGDLRVTLDLPPPAPELPPERDPELEAAEDEVVRLEEGRVRLEALAQEVADLPLPPRPRGRRGEPPPSPAPGGPEAFVRFRKEAALGLHQEEAALRQRLRLARERLAALRDRRARATTARQPRPHELRKSVWVRLHPQDAAPVPACHLVVEYAVPGARWSPSCAVHLEDGGTRARIMLRAHVAQRSGEDWTGVLLHVTTADDLAWHDLPELPSLRIGRAQPAPPRTGWRPAPTGAQGLYADLDRALPAPRAAPPPPPAASPAPSLPDEAEEMTLAMDLPDVVLEDAAAPARQEMMARSAAPMASRARTPARASKVLAPSPAMPLGGAGMPPQPPEPPDADDAVPADHLLRYGALRMPGPDELDRGRLQPAPAEALDPAGHPVRDRQVLKTLRQVRQEAGAVGRLPLPAGHVPFPPDPDHEHAWHGTHPVDVPSDGTFHSVVLSAHSLPAEVRHVVVPREGREVYRTATWRWVGTSPLPAGPADVFEDDTYVLTAPLAAVMPGGRATIGLGVDEGVRVARNARFAEKGAGLLGGALGLEHEVVVEVANRRAAPVDLEVRERVPVVADGEEEVQVQAVTVDPAWEPFEQPSRPLQAGHRWRVRLEAAGRPGAERKLVLRYTVRIPARRELVGGNRREA